jgi:hypothetical protein
VNIDTSQSFSDGSRLGIALAFDGMAILLNQARFVNVDASIDSRDDSVIEELEIRLGNPRVFNVLQGFAGLSCMLSCEHEVVKRLKVGVRGTEYE